MRQHHFEKGLLALQEPVIAQDAEELAVTKDAKELVLTEGTKDFGPEAKSLVGLEERLLGSGDLQ